MAGLPPSAARPPSAGLWPVGPAARPPTSGLATAGLVCSLLGPCTLGVTALVGLVLGILALSRINRAGGSLGGRGLALGGICVGAATILLGMTALIIGIVTAYFGQSIAAGTIVFARRENLETLASSALTYARRHGGRLPPGQAWQETLASTSAQDPRVLAMDPLDAMAGPVIAMNAHLSGVAPAAIRHPARTVLFFECRPDSPQAGGPDLVAERPRAKAGYLVAFADGHVECLPRDRLAAVIWTPGQ
jgi:hypothetical protein